MNLTVEGARKRRAEVERQARIGDSESAHYAEDTLWRSVLRAIALGSSDARELAEIAISTDEIHFDRWYA